MSRKRRPAAAGRASNQRKPQPRKKNLWWKRPLVWIGGVATVLASGVAAAFGTGLGQSLFSVVHSTSRPAVTASPLAASKAQPLRVLSENRIELQELGIWSFPGNFLLPDNGPNLNDSGAVVRYMKAHGGYPVSSVIQLVVQNTRNYPIRILDMQVVKNCQAPLTGTLYYNPPQGADLSIEVGFNLDLADPEARAAKGPAVTSSLPNYFSQYTVSIKPGAQQVFDIRTVTLKHSCTFRYKVIVLDGQREVYQLIGDGKDPFKISAVVATTAAVPFAGYSTLYIGGDPSIPDSYQRYVKVNAKTFSYG